jgi:hypothetical protein
VCSEAISNFQCGVRNENKGQNWPKWLKMHGDFILTHSRGIFADLIRLGQSFRYHGRDRKYIRGNHAAFIASDCERKTQFSGNSSVIGLRI